MSSPVPDPAPGAYVVLGVDGQRFTASLAHCLRQQGYTTEVVLQVDVAAIAHTCPDLVLVVGDAGGSSLELCARMRSSGYDGGIVVLEPGATELDRVALLDAGADDVVEPSVAVAELMARVRAVQRRVLRWRGDAERPMRTASGLVVDAVQGIASFEGRMLVLGPRAFSVLATLVRSRGSVVASEELRPDGVSEAALHAALSRLRRVLRVAGVPDRIESVRGRGLALHDRD